MVTALWITVQNIQKNVSIQPINDMNSIVSYCLYKVARVKCMAS